MIESETIKNPLCICGCGKEVKKNRDSKQWNRYILGHVNKNKHWNWTEAQKNKTKEVMNKPEVKKKKLNTMNIPEIKEKYSRTMREAQNRPEVREAKSKATKLMWKNPDYIKKQIVARNTKFMNKKEQLVFDLINSICPNEWKWVGNGEVIIGGKCPDFINNGQNKLIEFFGDYWHKNDDAVEKIELFKKFGYDTLIIWESELKNIENVKLKISNFIYTI